METTAQQEETPQLENSLQIVNLSSHTLTTDEKQLLEKGLTFSPMSKLDKFEAVKDVYMFCRQLCFKLLYDRPDVLQDISGVDRGLFQDLMDLLQESEDSTGTLIITCDVESLYSNIGHDLGVTATKFFLE